MKWLTFSKIIKENRLIMATIFGPITVISKQKDVLLMKMNGSSITGTENLSVWNSEFTEQFSAALDYVQSFSLYRFQLLSNIDDCTVSKAGKLWL